MAETRKIAWKRLAIEATAIVVSILLAFAIDAWWEERRERQAEVVLLERLRTDFIEIHAALAVVEEEHRAANKACLFLMSVAVGDTLPAAPEVDRMVALVFLASRTFNAGSGAFAAFSGGDSSRLIRNQSLAYKLLAWPGLVEELQEEESNLQKGVAERWTPYLASRASLGPYVAALGEPMHAMPSHVSMPTVRPPLTVDADFLNHVLDRFKWQQIALRDIAPVRVAMEEILRLLESELEAR
ncbi:MAG: hypothetical protein IPJ97_00340 [Proteobacteria bacterium]|nr:hypothetical protein [Pseudomonadota bacterium]